SRFAVGSMRRARGQGLGLVPVERSRQHDLPFWLSGERGEPWLLMPCQSVSEFLREGGVRSATLRIGCVGRDRQAVARCLGEADTPRDDRPIDRAVQMPTGF